MASNSNDAKEGFYQARSVSLPSRSHPLALRFEEESSKLTELWIPSPPSSSPTSFVNLREGLQSLARVHDAVGNLLRMPGVQKAMGARKHERWVLEELDCSVRLLDMCGIARESLSSMAEHILGLQSALKTRQIGDPTVKERVHGYVTCRRSNASNHKSCMKMLRQINVRCEACGMVTSSDQDLSLVVRAMQEVRESTKAVFDSVFSVCLKSKSKSKSTRWRLGLKRKSLGRHEMMGELDLAIDGLLRKSGAEDFDAGEVQEKLRVIGFGISEVEMGLQGVFRRLINNRVLVLNIVSL